MDPSPDAQALLAIIALADQEIAAGDVQLAEEVFKRFRERIATSRQQPPG